jgi:hypothetical protein
VRQSGKTDGREPPRPLPCLLTGETPTYPKVLYTYPSDRKSYPMHARIRARVDLWNLSGSAQSEQRALEVQKAAVPGKGHGVGAIVGPELCENALNPGFHRMLGHME